MANFSGSYAGRAESQSVLIVSDVPDHTLALSIVSAVQNCTDPLWNGAVCSYCGTTDTVAGQGTQSGYYVNKRAGGDQDQGTFEGRVVTNGGETTVEGTWKSTGGTGKFSNVSANGTFKVRNTSATDVEVVWSGTHNLS